jgi:hypothetical protein
LCEQLYNNIYPFPLSPVLPGSWDKLPIAVGSKLTSGQIDDDGGDRVVMRPSLLQHGAYSQPLKEESCTAACLRLSEYLVEFAKAGANTELAWHNSTNPISYSVDAAIKRAP